MAAAARVLLVEDDELFRTELAEQLRAHEGYQVEEVGSVRAALERVREQLFDAIILDVGLPDGEGYDLCRRLRRQGVKAPILMLTARDGDADTILGLDSGANDYIAKPVRLGVLLARLRAQLRQFELSDDAVFTIGPYRFKPAAKMLLCDNGRKIHLTEKETAILKYLYRAGDRAVARSVLLDEVWGYNAGVTTHTLETHIYRLRQKIEPDASKPTILVTESGGYRLVR